MIDSQAVVDLLNEMFRLDPVATTALVVNRVECNAALAAHPTVQVGACGGRTEVGLVGVINGVLGAIGEPLVCSVSDGRDELTGFALYQPPPPAAAAA